MKRILTIIATVLALAACNNKNTNDMLVIYYSQTGATETVAQEIAAKLGADIISFNAVNAYNGTYNETIARCQNEIENGILPEIVLPEVDLTKYETIFLGYPIWFGTHARPVMTLVKEMNFDGKKIVPFCTFGSGGLNASIKDLKAALPGAEILSGYGVRNARLSKASAEIERFLIENGHLEGEVELLPEFSEQLPVTEEETTIFNAACGDYQFPLGTPVTCGKRTTANGTEYLFKAQSTTPDGKVSESTIPVIVEPNAKPMFTIVIRETDVD